MTIEQEHMTPMLAFLEALAGAASPALSEVIERERAAIGLGTFVGLDLGEALGRLNAFTCEAGDTVLCLNQDRFKVEARWRTQSGDTGAARAVPLTGDSGYFWFFDDDNIEIVVKALAGCTINDRFWVFAGGLTNVEVDLTVTDTASGDVRTYHNAQSSPYQPLQDTAAFSTCGAVTEPGSNRTPARPPAVGQRTPAPRAGCVASDTALCVDGGQFRVEASFETSTGATGEAKAVPLTGDAGYFWFFNADNVEVVVKVLNACVVNQHHWVFAAGLTDVEVTLRVTDTVSGETRTYVNPQKTPFQPLQDIEAFARCE